MALMVECSQAAMSGDLSVLEVQRSLGERFASGEERAFEEVVRQYEADIGRLARRLLGFRPGGDAEDVVQEVFVRVYLKRHSFRGESSLRTWLMRITVNCIRSTQRRRILTLEMLWRSRPREESALERGPEISEQARQAREAIAKLASRDREVVVLHYLEEMPVAIVAEVTGISQGAVMVRLHRARKKLADLLGGLRDE